ncbi:MAG: PQQ-binding-like beta-propeller repeat protein [bacterium]|nr:PQQ-binding-like beta-propeller repeat protein [bacterium]
MAFFLSDYLSAQLADSPSPKFRINNRNTGLSSYGATPEHIRKNTGIRTNWRYFTGDIFHGSPCIGTDGKVYTGDYDSYFYCFNRDGTLNWRSFMGASIDSSPAVRKDGDLYVGGSDNNIYGLNSTGGTNWREATAGWVESSPAIADNGRMYIGCNDGFLYCFNPDGSLRWKSRTPGGTYYSSPAFLGNDRIIIGGTGLSCFFTNGSTNWIALNGQLIWSSPAVGDDNRIYAGSRSRYLYCLDPDGSTNWKAATGLDIYFSSPAIDKDGNIYIGCWDNYIYSFNPDGRTNWRSPTGGQIRSSPLVGSDNRIYIGSDDGYLYCFNPDGTTNWKAMTGGAIYSSPVIGFDGHIYIGSSDQYFYSFSVPGWILSPAASPSLSSSLDHVVIAPNPFKPGSQENVVTFFNLPVKADIKVYTVSGGLITHLTKNDGRDRYTWNARDSSGRSLATGIYLCLIKNYKGEKKLLQFIVN